MIADDEGEETVIPMLGPRFLIGRAKSCQLRSLNPLVSRRHAVIEVDGDVVFLHDLDSSNGTLRNGEIVTRPVLLQDGDRIQVGPMTFTVSIGTIGGFDEPPSIEDEVNSWLIDEANGHQSYNESADESDSGDFGDATQIQRKSP